MDGNPRVGRARQSSSSRLGSIPRGGGHNHMCRGGITKCLAPLILLAGRATPKTSWSAEALPESGQITLGRIPVNYVIDEDDGDFMAFYTFGDLSLIHISEPTR